MFAFSLSAVLLSVAKKRFSACTDGFVEHHASNDQACIIRKEAPGAHKQRQPGLWDDRLKEQSKSDLGSSTPPRRGYERLYDIEDNLRQKSPCDGRTDSKPEQRHWSDSQIESPVEQSTDNRQEKGKASVPEHLRGPA